MRHDSWVSWRSVVAILGVAAVSMLTMCAAQWWTKGDLQKSLFTGATTLLFGGLLGGFLKILLDDVVAARVKRADAATFVGNIPTDLKAVYDRVGRSQIIIPAHRSIKTYGDEMRDLIEARVQLKNVVRAVEGRSGGVTDATRAAVVAEVTHMKSYLSQLTTEFMMNYKELSDLQRAYEARAKSITEEYGGRRGDELPESYPTFPWERLLRLPVLTDFINEGGNYQMSFEGHMDRASEILRVELARILGRDLRAQRYRQQPLEQNPARMAA